MIEIGEALDPADIAAARTLFQEYQEALGVDLSFQSFAAELETLPGETLPSMEDAQRLYERLGFKDVPAYRHNPIAGTRFLAVDLCNLH